MTASTVEAWTHGMGTGTQDGKQSRFEPVIVAASRHLLSFENLIELNVIQSLRKIHGVSMPQIRIAMIELRKVTKSEHPLAHYDLLTDRKDVIFDEIGGLLNLSRYRQQEMAGLLESTLQKVGFENGEWRYRPVDSVEFSPTRQFGRPCIVGTRIPTHLVFVRNQNGESVDEIAYDLECETRLVQDAIEYESESRAA